ncbi:MAG: hypothetical protein RMK35_06365, partial [Aquificaceae bacterium]|nr:hypothetical protein [Aquificaceae bacterium]
FELAMVFLVMCLRDYLKENGKIAFVLPYSLLTGDQNQWLRTPTNLKAFKMYPLLVYDLKEVSPLFNQASCVLVVEKKEHRDSLESIPSLVFSGRLPRRNASLAEAERYLQEDKKELYVTQGRIVYWTYKKDELISSHYLNVFRRRAEIHSHSFWFIERLEVPMGQSFTEGIYVRSKNEGDEKLTVELRGHLPERFFFKTLLSKRMYPFGWTQLDEVFLPLKVEDGKYKLLDYYELKPKGQDASNTFWEWLEKSIELTDNMKDWLSKAQKTWEKWRGEKAKQNNILDWLNYRHKLTDQPVEGGYLVLYTTSGTNPCACVIEKDKRFIADTTTYYALMRSKEEALYVASLLNSRVLANMISNNQARGAFGERHIHTLPLQYIPPFNPEDPLNLKLVEVAKKAHEKAGRP